MPEEVKPVYRGSSTSVIIGVGVVTALLLAGVLALLIIGIYYG
jgi:hypothetical protein